MAWVDAACDELNEVSDSVLPIVPDTLPSTAKIIRMLTAAPIIQNTADVPVCLGGSDCFCGGGDTDLPVDVPQDPQK